MSDFGEDDYDDYDLDYEYIYVEDEFSIAVSSPTQVRYSFCHRQRRRY